jgi:hypothetical protein
MHHPDYKYGCAVPDSKIPALIKEGWIKGRKGSSTTGRIWIHKGEEKLMVDPCDLSTYENKGWIKGLPESPTKGKVWLYRTLSDSFTCVDKAEVEQFIKEGWIKKKWAPVKKGTAWINDGSRSIRVDKGLVKDYISSGWNLGPIKAPMILCKGNLS